MRVTGGVRYPRNPNVSETTALGVIDLGENPLNPERRKDTEMEELRYAEESKDSINLGCFRAFPSVPWLKNSFAMDMQTASDTVVYLLAFPH